MNAGNFLALVGDRFEKDDHSSLRDLLVTAGATVEQYLRLLRDTELVIGRGNRGKERLDGNKLVLRTFLALQGSTSGRKVEQRNEQDRHPPNHANAPQRPGLQSEEAFRKGDASRNFFSSSRTEVMNTEWFISNNNEKAEGESPRLVPRD